MLSFTAVAEAFVADCLGGRVEPFGDDFEDSSIEVPSGAEYIEGLDVVIGSREETDAEGSEKEDKEAA
jgi:hypothetical protein